MKRGMGALVVAAVTILTAHFLIGQESQPQSQPTQPTQSETAPAVAIPAGAVSEMPEFGGIDQWFNTQPLTKAQLKGKVVLVDFWTYSCINCLRTLPYLKDWYKKYQGKGLVIIGMHSPEFEFERDPKNVKAAIDKFKIPYPVAMDNKMQMWTAYKNQAWPAHYLIDASGKIRSIHYGEGDYESTEGTIQKLLMERTYKKPETQSAAESQPAPTKKGRRGKKAAPEAPEAKPTAESQPTTMPPLTMMPPNVDFGQIKSPETYTGFLRRERLVTSGRPLELNEWMYDGKWRTEGERIFLVEGMGKIQFRFSATKVNVVMSPEGTGTTPISAVVLLDGQPVPKEKAGKDVQGAGVLITEPRMYELINLGDKGEEHTIEIQFLAPNVGVYSFTFG